MKALILIAYKYRSR